MVDARTEINAILDKLYNPGLKRIDLGLERILDFLAALGSPQERLPPVIHVAGTNGKGSLVAYLHAIFEAAGHSVHRYISPHLVRFNERIVLRGKEIDDMTLLAVLREVHGMAARRPVTFFEATTAAAFLAFAEVRADVLLLETGMGGRLDATNVIAHPALTAITPVSIDHAEFLGDTLPAIAREKAGILKTGVPCVTGPQEETVQAVLEEAASARDAPLYRFARDWRVEERGGLAYFRSRRSTLAFTPGLRGAHQRFNAATAIACIEQLPGWGINDRHVQRGIASVVWPGRLQRLEHGALSGLLPGGWELWLDGGHNPAAGEALAQWARTQGERPLVLVCGMVEKKDVRGFLAPLAPFVSLLVAVPIPDEALSQPAAAIMRVAAKMGMRVQSAESAESALSVAVHAVRGPARVLICGSLYLAGKVLAAE